MAKTVGGWPWRLHQDWYQSPSVISIIEAKVANVSAKPWRAIGSSKESHMNWKLDKHHRGFCFHRRLPKVLWNRRIGPPKRRVPKSHRVICCLIARYACERVRRKYHSYPLFGPFLPPSEPQSTPPRWINWSEDQLAMDISEAAPIVVRRFSTRCSRFSFPSLLYCYFVGRLSDWICWILHLCLHCPRWKASLKL